HLVADRHADAPRAAGVAAEAAEGQVLDRELAAFGVGAFDPAFERAIVGVGAGAHCLNSRWCRKAPCLGARLVFDHSSSMSHLTASSFLFMASSSGSGQASSSRWPLGSKK